VECAGLGLGFGLGMVEAGAWCRRRSQAVVARPEAAPPPRPAPPHPAPAPRALTTPEVGADERLQHLVAAVGLDAAVVGVPHFVAGGWWLVGRRGAVDQGWVVGGVDVVLAVDTDWGVSAVEEAAQRRASKHRQHDYRPG